MYAISFGIFISPAFFSFYVIYFTSIHIHSIYVWRVQLLGSLVGLFSFLVTLRSKSNRPIFMGCAAFWSNIGVNLHDTASSLPSVTSSHMQSSWLCFHWSSSFQHCSLRMLLACLSSWMRVVWMPHCHLKCSGTSASWAPTGLSCLGWQAWQQTVRSKSELHRGDYRCEASPAVASMWQRLTSPWWESGGGTNQAPSVQFSVIFPSMIGTFWFHSISGTFKKLIGHVGSSSHREGNAGWESFVGDGQHLFKGTNQQHCHGYIHWPQHSSLWQP